MKKLIIAIILTVAAVTTAAIFYSCGLEKKGKVSVQMEGID